MDTTPKEVYESTTEQIRSLIDEILKIEKKYQHIQNISQNASVETDISEEILKIIYREVQ
jgi:hypothetical protein